MLDSSLLITNLALLFLIASVTVLFFRRLGLPSILGFLMAGLAANAISQSIGFELSVNSIQALSEIGLIFLLFTIGIDFSYKNLFRLRFAQFLATASQVLLLLGLTYQICRVLGYSSSEALFLSSAFCFCSTAIIVKTLSDLDLKGHRFLNSVFVVLLIEDLLTVLLLVNLTSYQFDMNAESLLGSLGSIDEVLWSLVKTGAFIVTLFLAGVFVLPRLFEKYSKELTPELTLILSTGACFLAVLISQRLGLSAALGAFLMGTILSTLPNRDNLQKSFNSIRDFFSAIFFVSIGLLVQIDLSLETLGLVLLFSFVIIFGKTLFVSFVHLIMGQSLKNSFYTGLSVTPIGEFSFVIAALGLSKGALDSSALSIVICVSFVTSLFAPLALRKRERLLSSVSLLIPDILVQKIQRYSDFSLVTQDRFSQMNVFKSSFVARAAWKSLLMIGLALLGQLLGSLDVFANTPSSFSVLYDPSSILDVNFDLLLVSKLGLFLLISLIFGVMAFPSKARAEELPERLQSYYPIFQIALSLWALVILTISLRVLFTAEVALFGVIMALSLSLLFKRKFQKALIAFEEQVSGNLQLKGLMKNAGQKDFSVLTNLPDQHMVEMVVCSTSDWRGRSLQDFSKAYEFRFLIPIIDRNGKRIFAPRGNEVLLSGDRLYVLGDEQNLIQLHQQIEDRTRLIEAQDIFDELNLELFQIEQDSPLKDKKMSDPEVVKALKGIVVSIDRNSTRITLPEGKDVIQADDRLWLLRSV